MHHRSAIFITTGFILFLLLPQFGVLLNIQGEGENLQNRTLSQFPAVSLDELSSASFGEKINEFVWDHLPLRTQLIKADHWVDFYVFRDSPIPEKVILGKNGWLFLYNTVMTHPKNNVNNVDRFVSLARRATQLQEKTGIEIVIVVSPTKASIYPEFLSDYHQKEYIRYASTYHNRLREAATAPDAKSLFLLWEPFREEKVRLLQDKQACTEIEKNTCYLFRPKDRHFGWETAIFQAKAIVDRIAPGKWQNNIGHDYLTPLEYGPSEMERRFIKISLPEPNVKFKMKHFLDAYSIQQKAYPIQGTNDKLIVFKTDNQTITNPVQKRAVIIHDSFMHKSKYLIAPYFQESIFIPWVDSKNNSFINEMIRSADVLVIESVESLWFYYLTNLTNILEELDQADK